MMSPWLYWPVVAMLALALLMAVGLIQFLSWKLVVDLFTAWKRWDSQVRVFEKGVRSHRNYLWRHVW